MRRLGLIASLAFALAAAGCSYRIVRGGTLDEPRFEQIQHRLEVTRGLLFKRPVPVSIVTAAEARAYLLAELRREVEPAKLRALTRVYSRLGLLRESDDLEKALLDLYQDQVAGFYDPEKKNLFLVKDALKGQLLIKLASALLRRDLAGEMFLAHELTHALQDQHFDIARHLKDVKQDDRSLARRAVYEGDATLSGFATLAGGLQAKTLERIVGKLRQIPAELDRKYHDVPEVLRAAVAFQYVEGTELVAQAYRSRGWAGVNALISDPPASTEQVMHPEKLFGRSDPPVEVDLSAFSPGPEDWKLIEQNTMGELIVLTLLRLHLAPAEAAGAAQGWGGDRLVAYERGDDLCITWMSAWDTTEDAAEFFAGLGRVMRDQRPGDVSLMAETKTLLSSASGSYYIERRKSRVLFLDHPPANDFAGVAAEVWDKSSFRIPAPYLKDLARTGGL